MRGDERKAIYDLISSLRLKMEKINITTEEEFQGDAYRTVEQFSFEIFDIYKNNQLFRNANRGKVWTFWNALVYCGTIYTTMGELQHCTGSINSLIRFKSPDFAKRILFLFLGLGLEAYF